MAATTVLMVVMMMMLLLLFNNISYNTHDDDIKTRVCLCVALNIICIQECVIFWQKSIENFHVLLLEFHNNLHIMYTKSNMDFIYLFKFFYSPHYLCTRAYIVDVLLCVCVYVYKFRRYGTVYVGEHKQERIKNNNNKKNFL